MADRIPITAAERIGKAHLYDQVVIYARRIGESGLEWVTTWGKDKTHCDAAATASRIVLLTCGQSLAHQWALYPEHMAAFTATMRRAGETRPIDLLDVSVGGTGILKRSRQFPAGYWWNEDTDRPGPCLWAAVRAIRATTIKPTVPLLVTGERDSTAYAGTTVEEDAAFIALLTAATIKTIDVLRREINRSSPETVPTFVQRLGPRFRRMNFYRGMPLVREAQAAVIDATPCTYWGSQPQADITTYDGLHYDATGRTQSGAETARAMKGRI